MKFQVPRHNLVSVYTDYVWSLTQTKSFFTRQHVPSRCARIESDLKKRALRAYEPPTEMPKSRKLHFVIHNQGTYDAVKKESLREYLVTQYGTALEGYLIAQEMYSHQPDDSHLQGNLFFKNAIHSTALVKLLKARYTPAGQESIGRVQVEPIKSEGRATSYMINSHKEGGDPTPLQINDPSREAERFNQWIDREIRVGMANVFNILNPDAPQKTFADFRI